MEKDK